MSTINPSPEILEDSFFRVSGPTRTTRRNWDAKIFTDNIVLGYAIRNDGEGELGQAAMTAATYQYYLALDGFFARGGMACGKLFMDELAVFGPALLEAYKMENAIADVPRIALSPGVVESATTFATQFYGRPETSPENQHILIDVDGVGFLNYLDSAVIEGFDGPVLQSDGIAQHRDRIQRSLREFRDRPKILAKYRWLAGYHNWFCNEVRDLPEFEHDLLVTQGEPWTPQRLIGDPS